MFEIGQVKSFIKSSQLAEWIIFEIFKPNFGKLARWDQRSLVEKHVVHVSIPLDDPVVDMVVSEML